MDGSIADSTMLRMRSGLTRAYQPAANSTANDFFEELLRLPVASTAQTDDPEATVTEPSAVLPTESQSTDSASERPPADESVEDEPTSSQITQPIAAGCYAPWTPPQNDPEPTATLPDEPVPSVPVPKTLASPSDSTQQPPIDDVMVQPELSTVPDEAVIQPVATADDTELVQPIRGQEGAGLDQRMTVAKDVRRTKPRDEKSAQPIAPPQHQLQSESKAVAPNDSQVVKPVADERQGAALEQHSIEQPTQAKDAPRGAKEDRQAPEREKWYESDNTDARSQIHDLLASEQDSGSQSNDSSSTDQNNFQELINQSQIESAEASAAVDAQASPSSVVDMTQIVTTLNSTGTATSSAASQASAKAESSSIAATGRTGQDSAINSHSSGHSHAGRGTGSSSSASASTTEPANDDIESRQLTQQERVRLVQRVARSFSRLGPDGGQVTLKLSPPQLGVLNVSIKIEGQTMTARLQTETAAARDTILENLPVLRERLSEQGIEVEKFQVEVASSEDFSAGQQGQTSDTSSGGASGRRSESSSDTNDYRRLRRDAVSQASERVPSADQRLTGWPDKSLDVKA